MKQKKVILAGLILSGSISLALQPAWAQEGGPGASDVPGSSEKQTIPERIQPGTPGSAGEAQPGMGHQGSAGMSSEHIKKVQEALKAKGHNPGPIDGIMASQTEKALREFQEANNLPATGVLDQQTAAKLGVELGAGTSGATGLSGSTEGGAKQEGRSEFKGGSKSGSQQESGYGSQEGAGSGK